MNDIYIDQNKPENVKIVCSFKQSYYLAKRLLLAQIYITVILTVSFSTAKFVLTLVNVDIAPYAALYALVVFIMDFFILQPLISKKRTDGAKLQEEFDCNVFKLDWDNIMAGKRVERDLIDVLHSDYLERTKGDIEKCKDWYPQEYKVFEINRAILACQKTSLIYDIRLRKRFNFLIVRNTILLSVLVATLCLIKDLSLQSFMLYVVLPLLPAVILAKRLYNEHEKSIKSSAELKSMIEDIARKNKPISLSDIKSIQAKIFTNRKDSALIPEKVYNRLRDKLEKQMHSHAASETNNE
jgi:hypothetical protein